MMYYLKHYVIDWEKVKTLDDVQRLLHAMNVTFEPDNPNVKHIEDLVRLEDKSREMANG